MGLGKTSITLTAINDLLFDSFEVHRVLVIAPLRVARDTWTAEVDKWDHLQKQDYIYCSVEFEEGHKSYYYIADEDNISVGDYVIVPVGQDNHHSVAEVVKVDYFAEEDVPLPLDRTKHIIRKCTDEDFDPPKE